MSSEKTGFAGLEDMLSDASTGIVRKAGEQATSRSPSLVTPTEPQSATASNADDRRTHITAVQQQEAPSSGKGGALFGIAMLIIAILFFVANSGSIHNASDEPDNVNFVPNVPTSLYAQGIPEVAEVRSWGLSAMLSAVESGNIQEVGTAAANLKKSVGPKLMLNKTEAKESRANNALGLKALKAGNPDDAVKLFFDAFKLNSADVEITDNLGTALYAIGEYEAARKAFRLALSSSPKRSSAWMGLARISAHFNEHVGAANAFALAFFYSKTPKSTRQAVLAMYRRDPDSAVRNAAGAALAAQYASLVAGFLKPALGNLGDAEIPVLLPTEVLAVNAEGSAIKLHVINNDIYPVEVSGDGYKLSLGVTPNCDASYCIAGSLSAQKEPSTDVETGEVVDLFGGAFGTIIKNDYRETSQLVVIKNNVRYYFALGANIETSIQAANSALKLGVITTELLAPLPRLPTIAPVLAAETPSSASAALVISPASISRSDVETQPWRADCNILYEVRLETFGEGVTVELRNGQPGSSTLAKSARSSGGMVNFDNLCPGNYFLAVGNGDSVSVTPVRQFESSINYKSSLQLQRGSGNVTSKSRGLL